MQLSGKVEVRVEPVGDPHNGCADPLFTWSWLNRHPFDWRGSNEMHFNPAGSSGPLPVTTCPRCLVAKSAHVDCGPLKIPRWMALLTPVPEWPNLHELSGFAGFYRSLGGIADIPLDNVVEFDGWGGEIRNNIGFPDESVHAVTKTCLYSPIANQDGFGLAGGGALYWGWFHPVLCDPSYWPYGFSYTLTTDVWQTTYWYIVWSYQGGGRYNPTLSLRSRVQFVTRSFLESVGNSLWIDYRADILSLTDVTEPQAYDQFNAAIEDVREIVLVKTSHLASGTDITYADLCTGNTFAPGSQVLPSLPESITLGAA